MGLETGTFISDLVATNPTPDDPKAQGDDHLRLIKTILKVTFPAFTGPMPIAHDRVASIDYVNQTAFNTALPAQPGGTSTYNLVTVNGAASWQQAKTIYEDPIRLAQVCGLNLALS
jgi:hypothetical protein